MIHGIRQVFADWQIIAAWVIFLASYFVFAFGRLPGTKIDRPAMAVVGASLMFVFRILTPKTAIASVDFGTLGAALCHDADRCQPASGRLLRLGR